MSDHHWTRFIIAAALTWLLLLGLQGPKRPVTAKSGALDLNSYYFAAVVVSEGGDPYDVRALRTAARDRGTSGVVHPFFYPPPFLLVLSWMPNLTLPEAYRVWFWLDILATLGCLVVLWRWTRRDGVEPVILVGLFALMTAIPNNHIMGQANLPVVLLAWGGLWAEDRHRSWVAGFLMGCACMAKMSPALFVLWWILERRWRAVFASGLTGILLTAVSLSVVSVDQQVRFYTEVLPGFGSGDYNGLSVPIQLYGNHGIPNLWHLVFPAEGRGLSPMALWASRATVMALLAGITWAVRRPSVSSGQMAARAGAITCALLLVPVYSYEHHLVWALLPMVIAVHAVWSGRLGLASVGVIGPALVALCFEQAALKRLALSSGGVWEDVIRESKCVALMALLLVMVQVGRKEPHV